MTCGCYSHNGFVLRSPEGLLAQQINLGLDLDPRGEPVYIDKVGSVSAFVNEEIIFDDSLLEEQYRRFNHGS